MQGIDISLLGFLSKGDTSLYRPFMPVTVHVTPACNSRKLLQSCSFTELFQTYLTTKTQDLLLLGHLHALDTSGLSQVHQTANMVLLDATTLLPWRYRSSFSCYSWQIFVVNIIDYFKVKKASAMRVPREIFVAVEAQALFPCCHLCGCRSAECAFIPNWN